MKLTPLQIFSLLGCAFTLTLTIGAFIGSGGDPRSLKVGIGFIICLFGAAIAFYPSDEEDKP